MIDFENEIYTLAVTAVRESVEGVKCMSVENPDEPELPAFACEQLSNPVYTKRADTESFENAVRPRIKTTAYTRGDKVLAKKILKAADEALLKVGLIRTFGPQRIKNDNDNVCEMLCYYDANSIDANGYVYGR